MNIIIVIKRDKETITHTCTQSCTCVNITNIKFCIAMKNVILVRFCHLLTVSLLFYFM